MATQQAQMPGGNRELLPAGGTPKKRSAAQIAAAASSGFDYPATQVGVVGNITVFYDPSLGDQGLSLATQMLGVVAAGPRLKAPDMAATL